MNSKPRFGLDLDGVCYNWSDQVRRMVAARFGVQLHEPDYWDYYKRTLTPEQWGWLWSGAIDEGVYLLGDLYPGTLAGLRALRELVDLVVISARPEQARVPTLRWLGEIGLNTGEVHLLAPGQFKSAVIPPCALYLDDGPHNVTDLLSHLPRARVMMMTRPWNYGYRPEENVFTRPGAFVRVENWGDVLAETEKFIDEGR